jgi:hypothetical protein
MAPSFGKPPSAGGMCLEYFTSHSKGASHGDNHPHVTDLAALVMLAARVAVPGSAPTG